MKSRFVILNLVHKASGEVDRTERFYDSRKPQRVADDLNQLLTALESPYVYRVPEKQ